MGDWLLGGARRLSGAKKRGGRGGGAGGKRVDRRPAMVARVVGGR